MDDKMKIYNAVRVCPETALKPIMAGRLKGKSDINPMWRIKVLTEQFGMVGKGWYYTIDKQWLESSEKETAAFVNISLYVNIDGEWSKPILGTGGAMFISQERNGAYTDDEAFKKALTDAISVACKALGIAANVYWSQDATKYDNSTEQIQSAPPPEVEYEVCPQCGKIVKPAKGKDGKIKQPIEIITACGGVCLECYKKAKQG